MSIQTHRSVVVDAAPSTVWAALQRVEDYPVWWPWLRELDAPALGPGVRWTCRISPGLPWSLRLAIDLSVVEPGRVEAAVSGDVAGTARITVAAHVDGGTTIELESHLQAERGATAMLHRVAPSVSRQAHDRVVDRALAQFRSRALPADDEDAAAG